MNCTSTLHPELGRVMTKRHTLAFERPAFRGGGWPVKLSSARSRLGGRVCSRQAQGAGSSAGGPWTRRPLRIASPFSTCLTLHSACLVSPAVMERPPDSLVECGSVCLVPNGSRQSSYSKWFSGFPCPSLSSNLCLTLSAGSKAARGNQTAMLIR